MDNETVLTKHAVNDRQSRLQLCEQLDQGATIVDEFYWDKGHENGPEIHKISSNGIIWIYNYYTKRFITALIGRPGQIQRYYEMRGASAPQYLIDIARQHQEQGLNYK